MVDEKKGCEVHPLEVTDMECGIQEILEKSRELKSKDTHSLNKSKAKGMR